MRAKILEQAIIQKQANLLATGAVAVKTGRHTGRAASSRFVVRDETTEASVDWGDVNRPFGVDQARKFFRDMQRRLADQTILTVKGFVGPFPIEVMTPSSWHATFADNMFRETFIEALAAQAK